MTSQDEMRRQLNNAYIESKLAHIIEPMVASLLKDKPADNVTPNLSPLLDRLHDQVFEK